MDATVSFSLKSEVISSPPYEVPSSRVKWGDAYDDHLKVLRETLWRTKSALDVLPYPLYLKARDSIFPLARTGSQGASFTNRAGHKLMEAMEESRVWHQFIGSDPSALTGKEDRPAVAFADICGGPGSFAQAIYSSIPRQIDIRGFGMTLKDRHKDAPEGWYTDLLQRKNFTATFGIDGTGDIYQPGNVNSFISLVRGQPLRLVVADGGFEVDKDKVNYQEAVSIRLAFSQWYLIIRTLVPGGSFVLKLFDTFTPMMRSILFLSSQFFESTRIVKPKHSRVVNSERYLVGLGFKGLDCKWLRYLGLVHLSGFTEDTSIMSLVPISEMESDRSFNITIEKMNTVICERQINAIQKILESDIVKDIVKDTAATSTTSVGV
eukprot:Tbor_TRINITY_DN2684_c0_g1::TRINITY_DN2684_c0_g1_i1::g.17990::m.17990/K14589/CMTR1, FTSJD2, MTR1; cap1 methyltransferase